MRAASALVLVPTLLAACGEVERLDLAVRPRQDDFETQIQPLLVQVGCSRDGVCHTTPQGELRLVEQPDADDLQDDYLGVKAKIDLDDPDASVLLTYLLAPEGGHRPQCWASTESCAYRKLRAWIAWSADGDPRPQDVACDTSAERCP